MSDYQERNNAAKEVRRGIKEPRTPTANKKKPKVKGPWKVVYCGLAWKDWIWHHCATKELAEKMIRKHHRPEMFKIEYREEA